LNIRLQKNEKNPKKVLTNGNKGDNIAFAVAQKKNLTTERIQKNQKKVLTKTERFGNINLAVA